jgi:dienelactone hydrolase
MAGGSPPWHRPAILGDPMIRLLLALLFVGIIAGPARAIDFTWPDADRLSGPWSGEAVSFPSHSPFTLPDATDPERSPETMAVASFFRATGTNGPAPAVVMLHGSGGVLSARELTYGRQFAAMGVSALVVDAFAARRDRATSFTDRLINITEAMMLADAYAGLRWLSERPDIDPRRIAVVGFSYGGMASLYAVYEQVAASFSPSGLRFAGHAAFYPPCIAEFENRRTTGRPVLILMGSEDELVSHARCEMAVDDLRAGGSQAQFILYPGAYHQWDGGWSGPRRIGRTLDGCRLRVETDGTVRDRNTWLPMVDPFTRKIILGLCSNSDGYLIGRDDAVRARSNADLGRFLTNVLAEPRG